MIRRRKEDGGGVADAATSPDAAGQGGGGEVYACSTRQSQSKVTRHWSHKDEVVQSTSPTSDSSPQRKGTVDQVKVSHGGMSITKDQDAPS